MTHSTSAYIHIPFCEHICYYCDFNKVFLEGQPVDEYIEALLKEARLSLSEHPIEKMETLYIGGGTPTSLNAAQLDRLFGGLREILPYENGEFTVEANPGDLSAEKLDVMRNYGVNRISMGVQTFDDRLLKKIGRKHNAQDVYDTIQLLEKKDFRNVTIDLIYALPGQSLESFRDTVERALALDLPHYALYSLILENQTMFMNWVRRGKMHLPEQEVEAQMYAETIEAMEKAGRMQYEISNFAKPGFESKHNLVYWNNQNYFGIGAGASGYLENRRYKNRGPIQHYLKSLNDDRLPILEEEHLSEREQIEEEMFLGLRKILGVEKAVFEARFKQSITDVYGDVLEKLKQQKLIIETDTSIHLTKAGLFRGNDVFEEFLLNKND
ncbi:oxygen-independent coproporphyrinogen III oxidase [Enterococcus gilvus]|jgi:putative oxygen-independent coproporphyrinogen III oxidase|uniref:radical SAM family heme chaperone HemW n=1 Tax=Enterococcus gilvus TaxID=160453 RepID=UPI000DF607C0|nr:radical SAM family heme chaperone HemW [Enterococcus gilvus]AXG37861.1 oxygen-independent coproporphyrinogen III oxidase [Enterococcus gilvus]